MVADYGIYVRNNSGTLQAAVDDYHDLELTLRFNDVGGWRMTLPTQSLAAQALAFGGGLVVIRNGESLLSGDVRSLDRNWTANGDTLIADGPDDMTLLADELASPDPSLAGPPYNTQVADVRSGAAETVLKQYVNLNIGPGAVTARQRAGLVMETDTAAGAAVIGSARWQPLLELLQPLAEHGGLGMRLVQTNIGTGFTRQFSTYSPVDQLGAIFSADLGTLSSYRYTLRASEANYFIAGGTGEGTARNVREGGDTAAIATYGRIAQFLDMRNTTSNSEIDQTIADNLTSKAQKSELRLTPLDVPSLQFGTDYGLGDQIKVVVDGTTVQDVVRTVVITLTTDKGETVTPYVGSPALADKFVQRLFREMKTQAARLRNLERR